MNIISIRHSFPSSERTIDVMSVASRPVSRTSDNRSKALIVSTPGQNRFFHSISSALMKSCQGEGSHWALSTRLLAAPTAQ